MKLNNRVQGTSILETANLLKGIEKSYEKGKFLLEESNCELLSKMFFWHEGSFYFLMPKVRFWARLFNSVNCTEHFLPKNVD